VIAAKIIKNHEKTAGATPAVFSMAMIGFDQMELIH
jgi:hypothetical protein